jgi:hypothetical protein
MMRMKKLSYVVFSLLVIISSCKKIDELTKFNLNYDTSTTIPASTGINLPINFFTPDVETDSESEFAVNNTRKDLIEEIVLTKLTLGITSPANQDFSFLKSVTIFIAAEGLSEIEVASQENIPDDIDRQLELETTNADIKDYIKKDNFYLRVNTVTDELLGSDVDIDISSQFHVDAKILGI